MKFFSKLNPDTIIEIYNAANPQKLTSILDSLEKDKFLTLQNLEIIKFENYYKKVVSNLSNYKEVLIPYFQDVLSKKINDNELRNILYSFTLSDFTLEINEDLIYILKDEKHRFNYVQEEQIFLLTHLENQSIKTKVILSGNVIRQVLDDELLSKQNVLDYTTFYLVNNKMELSNIDFTNPEINRYIDFLTTNDDKRIDKILELMDSKSYFIEDSICGNLSSTEKEILLKRSLFKPKLSSFINLYNSLDDEVVLKYESYKERVHDCIQEDISSISDIESRSLEQFSQHILVNGTNIDLQILDLLKEVQFVISNLNINFQDTSIEVKKRLYTILDATQESFNSIIENDHELISYYINSNIEMFESEINVENYETLSLLLEDAYISLDIKTKLIQNYNIKPLEENSQLKIHNSLKEELVLELLRNRNINLCFKEVDEYRKKNDSNSEMILQIISYLAESEYIDSGENCYAKDSFKEINLKRFMVIWNKIKKNESITFDQLSQILCDNVSLLDGNFCKIIKDSKFSNKFIKMLEVVNSSDSKVRREIPADYHNFPLEVKILIQSEVKVGKKYFTKKKQ